MQFTNYILVSTIMISSVGISFWVYLANRKKAINLITGLLIILSATIILTTFLSSIQNPVFWFRTTLVITSLSSVALYYFILYFPRKIGGYPILGKIIIFLSSIFAGLAIFTDFLVSDAQNEGGYVKISGQYLNFFYVYLLFIAAVVCFILIKKYPLLTKSEKVRIRYFFLGFFIFLFSQIIFSVVLPIMNIENYYFIGDYSIVLFLGLTAYAIVKHRLLDIRMVVARSVAYIILIATIAALYVMTVLGIERIIFPDSINQLSFAQIVLRAVITLVLVFTFQPLRRFITRKTDKIFFKQSYNPERLLDTLSHTMGSSIVLIELMYKVLNILISDMKVSRGFFVLLKDGSEIYTTQGIGYKKSPKVKIHDIELLSEDGIVIYDELEEGSKKKKLLHRLDAAIAIPIKTEKEVSGILLIGEKSSGDMYSAQDLRILEILAPEVSVALENAKSYEEIQHFNAILRAEVQKATHDLETANQNLRELDKAKDEFISMASHQLRTPLTAIKGYLSMLLEGDAGEIKMGQYDFIKESYYGATRMVALINDLLNVSRMETGRFFLDPTDFDLNLLVEEEIKQLKKPLEDRGLKITFDKAEKSKMHADELKVRQVVMNFIDNAIYYSLEGRIKVRTYESGGSICFEVSDNGIGVPEDQQEHLFTKFYRAENARRTRPDGTGLGLFMAKRVINEHGGDIIFHSKEGEGSTFGFKIPLNVQPKGKTAPVFGETVPADTKVSDAAVAADEEIKKDVATAGIEVKEPVGAGQSEAK